MNSKKRNLILKIFKICYKKKIFCRLIYRSPFEFLVALILSSRSTDESVNRVTKKLFKKFNTSEKIIFLGKKKLLKFLKNIGLHNLKSKRIYQMCKILLKKFNNIIPNNRKDLELFPGVGRKISNLFLNVIFKISIISVDTHVFRFCNRTKFFQSKNVIYLEKVLNKIISYKKKLFFHSWVIQHCQRICLSRNPKCKVCFLFHICEFKKNKLF